MTASKMMILLLLLLSVVSSVLSITCPPNEDINPCRCKVDEIEKDLMLYCTDRTTSVDELKKILNAFDSKTILAIELYRLNLGPIQPNFFGSLKVRKLRILHCKLDGVLVDAGRALVGLEDTLEELIIHESFTADNAVSKFDLSHLRRLNHLYLSSNSIAELANDWFERGPVSLKYLNLLNNNIEKLGDTAFANLENLSILDLYGNRFGSIKRSMLPSPANKLYDVELENNGFTSLPEDIFSGMPALTHISLSRNSLTKIPKATFQPIWPQLLRFEFKGNNLECDSDIEWMLETVTSVYVIGTCSSPADKKGRHIKDFIKRGDL